MVRADRQVPGAGKSLSAEQVKKLIDQGPYAARAAKDAGLIDQVACLDQFQAGLKSTLKVEEVKIRAIMAEQRWRISIFPIHSPFSNY